MIGWWKAVDPHKPLALVQCSKTKSDVKVSQARNLYQGDLFEKSREYVELMRMDWRILSAEHGLVHPDQSLVPYDKSLEKMRLSDREEWGFKVACNLRTLLGGHRGPVVVLAGLTYRTPIFGPPEEQEDPHRRRDFPFLARLQVPMEGLAIGQQKAWLRKQCDAIRADNLKAGVREAAAVGRQVLA